MSNYILSKIDNKEYCISNGQFSRHLKSHNITRQSYYETYITRFTPLCPYCFTSRKFYQKNETYAHTCGEKSCAAKYTHDNRSAQDAQQLTQKKKDFWGNIDSDKKKEIVQKRKGTCLQRYGVESASQDNSVKEKIKKTCLERYGTESPLRHDGIKEKIKQTLKERYNVEHPMNISQVQQKVSASLIKKTYGDDVPTKQELEELYSGEIEKVTEFYRIHRTTAYKLLRDNNIDLIKLRCSQFEREVRSYFSDCNVIYNDKKTVGVELDIYFPDHNVAIECNGAYWHSELQGRDRNYHLNKTELCKENGIHLIHIWDHEWTSQMNLLISRIKSKLGINSRLYARKCDVAEINFKTAKAFLNKYHIQGSCSSSVNIGLYYKLELVAVMTFGKSRYDKNTEWELIRYCSKQDVNVVGGAGKLFSYFKKTYNPVSLISYSDKMRNSGGLYTAIGFEHSHSSSPAYYYTKNYSTFENRVAYQKHKLKDKLESFDPELTEWENMKINGYDRIWDCGTDVFLWR